MKKILTILFFSSFYFISNAQTQTEKQVQKVVIDLFEALSNRDTSEIRKLCTKDVMVFENGEVWNIDSLILIAGTITATDFKRINTISFINTLVNEKTAWTTYDNQADITMNGRHILVKWQETVILVKEEYLWKVKLLHSTLIKRSVL